MTLKLVRELKGKEDSNSLIQQALRVMQEQRKSDDINVFGFNLFKI